MATDIRSASRWILLPGTLCTADVFAPLMQALDRADEEHIVVPLDMPDISSYRKRLSQTVRKGDIVCGFSLGAIAVAHAADLLRDARALILIALNPRPDVAEKRPGREALRDAVYSDELAAALEAAAPTLFANPTSGLCAQIIDMAQQEARHIEAQTALALHRPGALSALRNCPAPVVFVTGEQDRQTPAELAHEAARATPRAALKIVPGLGHFGLLENPAVVAKAVCKGLEELGVIKC